MSKILIVEDEETIRRVLSKILIKEFPHCQIQEAVDGKQGLEYAQNQVFDLVFCDIKMPQKDGMELLADLQKLPIRPKVVMLSGHGDIDIAVQAMKLGAFDYIAKPPDLNRLLEVVRNSMLYEQVQSIEATHILKPKFVDTMIGETLVMRQVKELIAKVAPTSARVLITGANGSGKELVARAIHQNSKRSNEPMIELNCAAIPSELIESELFGHTKGAFTSAIKDREGKFEQAHKGTLFLDEIGDMSLSAQAKVLRVLQQGTLSPIGSDKQITVDVRVIAATNKNLKEEIAQGRFREDLYHRLAVILIDVPSLSERKDDIPLLIEYFKQHLCQEYQLPCKEFTSSALNVLQSLEWKGNVRELSNAVERLLVLGSNPITAVDVEQLCK